MSIEAMKLALEALEAHADIGIKSDKAITALRQAIEQAEQAQPVAYRSYGAMKNGLTGWRFATHKSTYHDDPKQEPLYTSPPPRQPLTDEEFISMVDSDGIQADPELAFTIKEMVEKAHGIYPENSDCHGRDWTERDEEYLK